MGGRRALVSIAVVRLGMLAAAGLAASGCSGDLLASLGRTAEDPVIASPRTASLVVENRIDVSWDEDPGADLYVLERSPDTAVPSYAAVYRGGGTAYTDDGLGDQSRYLYRLIKVRGARAFGPSEAVLGVSGLVIRDGAEPNDEAESATELTYDRAANLYYYRAYDGQMVQDTDWYWVAIPPRYRAYIVVTQENLASGATSYFYFYAPGGPAARRIVSGMPCTIDNLTYGPDRFPFRIFPYGEDFVGDPSGAGGTLVNYTVSLYRIEKL